MMKIEYVTIEDLENPTDQMVAKSMYKFWAWQLNQARIEMSAAYSRYNNAIADNKREQQRRQDDDEIDFGFGRQIPYGDKELERLKRLMDSGHKNYSQISLYYNFVIDYFINKAI